MKRPAIFSNILIFLLMMIPARPNELQESARKGTMETKGGVTIVSNPSHPLCREDSFRLEEDLSIGEAGGSREYGFVRPWYLAVDDEGLIYVMDEGDAGIKVYDQNGKYLRIIGRKGQGPGELQNPDSIHFLGNRQLVFVDFLRGLNFFTKDGRFERFSPTTYFINVLTTPDGRIIARVNVLKSEQPGKEIRIYDGELNLLKSILFLPEAPQDPRVAKPFAAGFHWALSQGNRIVLSYKPDYEIEVHDLRGTSSLFIRRIFDRVKISKEEIEDFRTKYRGGKTLDFPEYRPAIQGIGADDKGRIFAETHEKTKDRESFYYDVFDRDGRYLVRVPIPRRLRPLIWKNKKMYCLEDDEEGFRKVKRYRVLWQIPE